MNVTLFGNRVFAGIIKIRSLGRVDPNLTGVLTTGVEIQKLTYIEREDNVKTHKENTSVVTEAKI